LVSAQALYPLLADVADILLAAIERDVDATGIAALAIMGSASLCWRTYPAQPVCCR
jgi:hypothetical protein